LRTGVLVSKHVGVVVVVCVWLFGTNSSSAPAQLPSVLPKLKEMQVAVAFVSHVGPMLPAYFVATDTSTPSYHRLASSLLPWESNKNRRQTE